MQGKADCRERDECRRVPLHWKEISEEGKNIVLCRVNAREILTKPLRSSGGTFTMVVSLCYDCIQHVEYYVFNCAFLRGDHSLFGMMLYRL